MRELTEQEIKYRDQKCNELCPSGIDMVIGFDNGFIAGIDYQQAEVERLRDALEKITKKVEYWQSLNGVPPQGCSEFPYWNLGDIAKAALK